jgi:hypothetical protein
VNLNIAYMYITDMEIIDYQEYYGDEFHDEHEGDKLHECAIRAFGMCMTINRGWHDDMYTGEHNPFNGMDCTYCFGIINKLFNADMTMTLCFYSFNHLTKARLYNFVKKHKWFFMYDSLIESYVELFKNDIEMCELFVKYGGTRLEKSLLTDSCIAELLEFPHEWKDWSPGEFDLNIKLYHLRRMPQYMGAYVYDYLDCIFYDNSQEVLDKYIQEFIDIIPYAYIAYRQALDYIRNNGANRYNYHEGVFTCNITDGYCSIELFERIFSYSDKRDYIIDVKSKLANIICDLSNNNKHEIKFAHKLRKLILTKYPRYTYLTNINIEYGNSECISCYGENKHSDFFLSDFRDNYYHTLSPELIPHITLARTRPINEKHRNDADVPDESYFISYIFNERPIRFDEIERFMTDIPIKNNPLKRYCKKLYLYIYGQFDKSNLLEFYRYFIINPYTTRDGIIGHVDYINNQVVMDIFYKCWLERIDLSPFIYHKMLDAFIIRHGRETAQKLSIIEGLAKKSILLPSDIWSLVSQALVDPLDNFSSVERALWRDTDLESAAAR